MTSPGVSDFWLTELDNENVRIGSGDSTGRSILLNSSETVAEPSDGCASPVDGEPRHLESYSWWDYPYLVLT
jgi:hypothetical protein